MDVPIFSFCHPKYFNVNCGWGFGCMSFCFFSLMRKPLSATHVILLITWHCLSVRLGDLLFAFFWNSKILCPFQSILPCTPSVLTIRPKFLIFSTKNCILQNYFYICAVQSKYSNDAMLINSSFSNPITCFIRNVTGGI